MSVIFRRKFRNDINYINIYFAKGQFKKYVTQEEGERLSLKKCLTGGGGIVKNTILSQKYILSQNVSAYIFLQISFYSYVSHHGTIITTKITCKKVPSYVSNSVSACRRQIVNKHFRILPHMDNCTILLDLCK